MNNSKPMARRINLLLSLLIAFAAWLYVVYNVSPVKEVTYKNVPVAFIGEDVLAESGYTVEKASIEEINVTLNIERSYYNDISSDDIYVMADVSEAVEGHNTIALVTIPPEGATLVRAGESSISVDVQKGTSKTVDVAVVYSGRENGESEPVANTLSAETVTVYGSADALEDVKYVALKVPGIITLDKETHTLAPEARDEAGNPVKHVVVSPERITVNASDGVTKVVLLDVKTVDKSGVDKTVGAPTKITIKGDKAKLDKITTVTTEEIDLTDIKENKRIPLKSVLPEGITLASMSTGETVKVNINK